ncbi:riboflavin biosynthesis protein RibF [Alkalilimnicola ehrlichii]|uniref:Riboflavin biosynthesis protein n=1 Tax=Alkalilimnicola ehrlichii TaxID=351052 RepID=A0A3E0X183_9GAMM|nr:bifunctional riboflavin kinase/FAD synthetase [Alkalilimnicola ehrlichii]RFA30354.1 riboflavin biosynthesis protein RibF [Alkalilimnicola ehrlichii]RFA37927.1 riboflavin biosynthesis protein RibF [Alkalilimnicola ehrlichii]
MELIRGLHNLRPRHRGAVATIGNFDGVHRGHQAMLAQLQAQAACLGGVNTLITFEPHPLEFFRPDIAPSRLTSLRDKLDALQEHGVERVLCLRFDGALASIPAEQFVQRILIDGLGVRYLLVGDDFRFGAGRRGDFSLLAQAAKQHDFELEQMGTVAASGQRISSTRVREALAAGELELAGDLLGRPYCMSGRVIRGQALGRNLGYPTANIGFGGRHPPMTGIFAVRVHGLDKVYNGAASLGYRPTVNGKQPLLEVYLLDFEGDLYGRHLRVEFCARLREEERFESLEALTQQIAADTEQVRRYFANEQQHFTTPR